jgi:hypothetical protein
MFVRTLVSLRYEHACDPRAQKSWRAKKSQLMIAADQFNFAADDDMVFSEGEFKGEIKSWEDNGKQCCS